MTNPPQTQVETQCTAFIGHNLVATGGLTEVALALRLALIQNASATYLVFDDKTSAPVELDLRGSAAEVEARYKSQAVPPVKPGPGRPKLGVVAREVTLLPRQWEWLGTQRGGASVTLRRLVDEARKDSIDHDLVRLAQDRAYRFMIAIGGDLPNFEELLRELYARREGRFSHLLGSWPKDLQEHVAKLAAGVFPAPTAS